MNRKKRIFIGLILMIAIMGGVYLYSHFNPEEYRFFPKCPVYFLTGYKCPGCGSQRAFYHIFQGNIMTAFRLNPLMLLIVPYVLTGIYLEYIINRTNPRTVRLRELLFGKWAVLVLAITIVIYTIVRNQLSFGFLLFS
jgi:hypothetical protein